jgi:integrase
MAAAVEGTLAPAKARASEATFTTVRHLCGFYKGTVVEQGKNRNTKKGRRAHLRNIARIIGEVPLDALGPLSIERYRSTRRSEGLAASSINLEVSTLQAAVNWGRELGRVGEVRFPKRLRTSPIRCRRTPTDAEYFKVLEAFCAGWPRLAYRLAWETGARPHELHVSMSDVTVDDGNGWVRMTGKTGPRRVPITRELAEALLAWGDGKGRERDQAIFGVTVRTITERLRQENRKACERAGVQHFHPYGLRRATDDRLGRERVDPATWAAFTGHSVETASRMYRQVTESDLRRALRGASAKVLEVDFGKKSKG